MAGAAVSAANKSGYTLRSAAGLSDVTTTPASTRQIPATRAAVTGSDSTVMASVAATAGSSSPTTTATLRLRRFRPTPHSEWASVTVTNPRYTTIEADAVEANAVSSEPSATGSIKIAPVVKIVAIVVSNGRSRIICWAANPWHGMPQPASTPKATPLHTTSAAPPDSSTTPASATATPASQRRSGRCRYAIQSITPATSGPTPIATRVPTATPVRAVASKNESWLATTPNPPSATQRAGSRYRHGACPRLVDTNSSPAAPITPRHAPVATGLTESGPNSAAVPMVPISEVARATAPTPQNVEPRARSGSRPINAHLEPPGPQQASIVLMTLGIRPDLAFGRADTLTPRMSQNPTSQDPTSQDPTSQDPTSQDPTSQDPTSQDPTALAPMTDRLVRPDWVRRINLMAGSVGGRPQDLVPIDAADLVERAVATVGGLPDGDLGDPRWQERFEALVTAVDAAPMHVVGRLMTKQELLRSLQARLLLTAAIDAAPEITQRPVTAPVIITGPARSGTTILFELLALDPGLRAPTAAEALHPVPFPAAAGASEPTAAGAAAPTTAAGAAAPTAPTAPAAAPAAPAAAPAAPAAAPATSPATRLPGPVVLSECEQEFWADVQPEFQALHELRSDLPVECVTITQGSFCGFHWNMISSFDSWMPDPAVNYAYERQFLQVLQHGTGPTQWVLKTPAHLMLLPLLFAEFNDAWVVQTHRDPAKTMPSTVSTTAMIQWLRTDHIDVDGAAQNILAVFAAGLNGSVHMRESGMVPAERFVDVHFAELMTDPAATLRAAYARMGRDFTDDHAAAVLDYLARKPKGKFGAHRYQPEDWGYTAESLRQAMAPYIDHFGVSREG